MLHRTRRDADAVGVHVVDRRDELQQYLRERGIKTAIHYPIPIHRSQAYEHLGERDAAPYGSPPPQGPAARPGAACGQAMRIRCGQGHAPETGSVIAQSNQNGLCGGLQERNFGPTDQVAGSNNGAELDKQDLCSDLDR